MTDFICVDCGKPATSPRKFTCRNSFLCRECKKMQLINHLCLSKNVRYTMQQIFQCQRICIECRSHVW